MRRDERIRVAVIGGGGQLRARRVARLRRGDPRRARPGRYDVVALTIDRAGIWRDREDRPIGLTGAAHVLRSCDVAFPVLHGPHGEDGTLAASCELADLPYVGSGVAAGAMAMDKWATKLVARRSASPPRRGGC